MDTDIRLPRQAVEMSKISKEEEQHTKDNHKTRARRLAGWLYNTAGSMGRLYWLRKDHVHSTRVWFDALLSSYFKILRSQNIENNSEQMKTCIKDTLANISLNSTLHISELSLADSDVLNETEKITEDPNRTNAALHTPVQETHTTANRSVAALLNERFYTTEDTKEMPTLHYVDKRLRSSCKTCGEKFSYRRRPRHCRRCGEVFCSTCVQFQRRLNKLAQLDPDGVYKKVCQTCYKEAVQELGNVRRLTEEFVEERQVLKCERVIQQRFSSKTQTFWRDQLNVEAECRRLLEGFEQYVGQSEPYKAVQDLHSYMAVPYWQRSKFWQVENMTRNCRQCQRGFGFRKTRRNCKVCSLAVCKQCSNKELLIYYDDFNQKGPRSAHLALINVDGCPLTEPDISLLLYVCSDCKNFIQEKQEDNPCWYERLRDDSPLAEINRMNILFDQLTNKITAEFQKGIEKCYNSSKKENQNMSHLCKHLDDYHTLYKSLENLLEKAETKQQFLFIKNYLKGKYDFYMKANNVYRTLNKEMDEEE